MIFNIYFMFYGFLKTAIKKAQETYMPTLALLLQLKNSNKK